MSASVRFAYMTNSLENLDTARTVAGDSGFAVDMLPLGAPPPEPGTFDGVMVDFSPVGGHALARKMFLNKLTELAKELPVVVYDRAASYQETAAMRAAGIKWFPSFREKAFGEMLAHPLSAKVAAAKAARAVATEIELLEVE